MTNKQIIESLKTAVAYDYPNSTIWNICCSIPEGLEETMTSYQYSQHYDKMRAIIDSLPWISIKDRLPETDGRFLTLLDCDEHKIVANNYRSGNWGLYNNTHVCHWMPIPEENDQEIDYKPTVPFVWKDCNSRRY